MTKKTIQKKKLVAINQKTRINKNPPLPENPCITNPNTPHECSYMRTCWTATLRCMEMLEGHYSGHQNESLRGVYLPHIYEIMFILRPIHMAWPHFIPQDKMEIYYWAEAIYVTWLNRPEINKRKRID